MSTSTSTFSPRPTFAFTSAATGPSSTSSSLSTFLTHLPPSATSSTSLSRRSSPTPSSRLPLQLAPGQPSRSSTLRPIPTATSPFDDPFDTPFFRDPPNPDFQQEEPVDPFQQNVASPSRLPAFPPSLTSTSSPTLCPPDPDSGPSARRESVDPLGGPLVHDQTSDEEGEIPAFRTPWLIMTARGKSDPHVEAARRFAQNTSGGQQHERTDPVGGEEHLRPHSAFSSPFDSSSPPPSNPEHIPNLPPIGQSFLRMSKTASEIFSDSDRSTWSFHAPPAPSSTRGVGTSTRRPSQPDAAFHRMSHTTATFSDLALADEITPTAIAPHPALPTRSTGHSPFRSPATGESVDDSSIGLGVNPRTGRRGSGGTFGGLGRRPSDAGTVFTIVSGISDKKQNEVQEEGSHLRDNASRQRPLSMSSATDSSFSSPLSDFHRHHNATESPIGTSSPPRKATHKSPETDQAINAHLLQISQNNKCRIVPTTRHSPPTLSPHSSASASIAANPFSLSQALPSNNGPPSVGTPLRGNVVREESSQADSSDSDLSFGYSGTGGPSKRTPPGPGRRFSKVDQILGEGAEDANVRLELEKKAIERSLQHVPASPGVNPTTRGHRPYASFSGTSTAQGQVSRNNSVATMTSGYGPYSPSSMQSPGRSASIDSIPSLHPSMSDSINTLSRLLPPSPIAPSSSFNGLGRLALVPQHSNLELGTSNDLNPEQRATLLRRHRKLEQILGESLDEKEVERLMVRPINATRTIFTGTDDDIWPSSPDTARRRAVPEWAKEDCVPKISRAPVIDRPALNRSGSSMVRKAKAAFGLDKGKDVEGPLEVFVAREKSVAETTTRQYDRSRPAVPRQASASDLSSPKSSRSGEGENEGDEDEAGRRLKRNQLAKLHRLLGVPIPPALLVRNSSDSGEYVNSPSRADSPSDTSFMSFDDEPAPRGWASKFRMSLKNGTGRRDGRKDSVTTMGDSQISARTQGPSAALASSGSFIDFSDRATAVNRSPTPLGSKLRAMTEKEKAVARRRAQKLEQMFGDVPPQSLFVPQPTGIDRHHPPSDSPGRRTSKDSGQSPVDSQRSQRRPRQGSIQSFEVFEQSLQGLLYLADHDPPTLVSLIDHLDDVTNGAEMHSPSSPPQRTGSFTQPRSPSGSPPSPLSPVSSTLHSSSTGLPDQNGGQSRDQDLDLDPHSHSARRRRKSKLTHFFGETNVEFASPPDIPTVLDYVKRHPHLDRRLGNPEDRPRSRARARAGTKAGRGDSEGREAEGEGEGPAREGEVRRQTLDSVLTEMWRNVHHEVRRGRMGEVEKERLREMMEKLRGRTGGIGKGLGTRTGTGTGARWRAGAGWEPL